MDLPGPIHDFLLVFLGLVLILGGKIFFEFLILILPSIE